MLQFSLLKCSLNDAIDTNMWEWHFGPVDNSMRRNRIECDLKKKDFTSKENNKGYKHTVSIVSILCYRKNEFNQGKICYFSPSFISNIHLIKNFVNILWKQKKCAEFDNFLHSIKTFTFLRNYTHNNWSWEFSSLFRFEIVEWKEFNWWIYDWRNNFFLFRCDKYLFFLIFFFFLLFDLNWTELEPCRSNVNSCDSSNGHKITNRCRNWGWQSKKHPKRSSSKFLST